jgi:hypothetical protein
VDSLIAARTAVDEGNPSISSVELDRGVSSARREYLVDVVPARAHPAAKSSRGARPPKS